MPLKTGDNNFGTARWIVSAAYSDGCTHTTIASALASASSGDTIFIRPGTYTENLNLVSGVNLTAYNCDSQTPNVTITGKMTYTAAGTVSISGIRITTNSDNVLSITGANAVNLNYINCSFSFGTTGFSCSNANAVVTLYSCTGNISTTLVKLFDFTGGTIVFYYSNFDNTGVSITASTISAGSFVSRYSRFVCAFTTSGTAAIQMTQSEIALGVISNTTNVTHGGSGTGCFLTNSRFVSGSAICISVGSGATLSIDSNTISSSNTNAVSGLGTISYSGNSFNGSSNIMNTTTQSASFFRPGISLSDHQPSFMAYNNTTLSNVTGDGTTYTMVFGTERYDIGNNYAPATGIFTAPYTGKYLLSTAIQPESLDATVTVGVLQMTTSNNAYMLNRNNIGVIRLGTFACWGGAVSADMDAADTAKVDIAITEGSGKVVDFTASSTVNWFSGILLY